MGDSEISRRGLLQGAAVLGVGLVAADLATPESASAYTFGTNIVAPPGYCHPFTDPVPPIGSRYQEYRTCDCTSPHIGTDYSGPTAYNRTIVSIGPGYVAYVGSSSGALGNFVKIQHANGVASQYAHMKYPSALQQGDPVFAGTALGTVGATGNAYGEHLHLELWRNGSLISPEVFLSNSPAAGGAPLPVQGDLSEDMMYIRRESTGEVAVFGGSFRSSNGGTTGRHIFTSQAEYNQWRTLVNFYNNNVTSQGLPSQNKVPLPPASASAVMGVSEGDWGIICGVYGV